MNNIIVYIFFIAFKTGQALHFNTFGGNPMASAVGLSVLDVIKEERCQENSLEVGTYLLQQLVTLVDKYEIVGDVRGKGLMIGWIFFKRNFDLKCFSRN